MVTDLDTQHAVYIVIAKNFGHALIGCDDITVEVSTIISAGERIVELQCFLGR